MGHRPADLSRRGRAGDGSPSYAGGQAIGYSPIAAVEVSWVTCVPSGAISHRSGFVACGCKTEKTISVPSGEKVGPDSDVLSVFVSLCRFDPSTPTHQMSGWIRYRWAVKTTADASGAH